MSRMSGICVVSWRNIWVMNVRWWKVNGEPCVSISLLYLFIISTLPGFPFIITISMHSHPLCALFLSNQSYLYEPFIYKIFHKNNTVQLMKISVLAEDSCFSFIFNPHQFPGLSQIDAALLSLIYFLISPFQVYLLSLRTLIQVLPSE